ncbi:MAG: response regulator transcription factor [Magnetococcales bacterium]|nr:response regulator transcription factor [Magnetococcales bacterium]
MPRIFIIEDHPVVREGIRVLLMGGLGCAEEELGSSGSGREGVRRLLDGDWEILLLDINLPDMDGLEILLRIKAVKPKLQVLVLTVSDEVSLIMRFIKAGASGYLTKTAKADEIVQAVKTIMKGKRYFSTNVSEIIASKLAGQNNDQLPHEMLSDREFTVLRRIGSGQSIAEIANSLHLSPSTISTYRARILEKMDLESNADLIRYVLEHNLSQ